MPALDPGSVVLGSPLLVTRFKVRRRSVIVNSHGRGKTQDAVISVVAGIVYASGDNGQERTEDRAIGKTTYQVITKFPLRKQAPDILPDIVLYAGMELLVIDVADYTRYGAGWVEATCTSDEIADAVVGSNTA